jgi:hypothetical protein
VQRLAQANGSWLPEDDPCVAQHHVTDLAGRVTATRLVLTDLNWELQREQKRAGEVKLGETR